MEKKKVSMQVSIPEELVEEFGGIEEILKHGVDKRYRDLNCRVEEGVLVSESMLHRETTYSKERCQCGYCITIEPNGFRWWNVEFECRPEELRVEEGDQYEYDEEISDGYFIEKIRPEMITKTFLVEVRNEEMYVVKKETRKHIVQRMTNEEEMRLALQKALDKVQHVAILAGYLVNVGVVERMSEEERIRHIPEWNGEKKDNGVVRRKMYELKIRKEVRGKAMDMIPLSESRVDRAVFNACIEVVLGREVQTDEEFEKVSEWKAEREDRIVEVLEKFGLIDVEKEEELVKLEKFVKKELEL